MRWLPYAMFVLVLPVGPMFQAAEPDRPLRFTASFRAGGFDEQGSDLMRRKDDGPGNPLVGWKGSEQIGVGFAFDVRPGLTLDLSYVNLDYDIGSDLVMAEPEGELVSTQIATGDLDEYRLAVAMDVRVLSDEPSYYISPERKSRGRIALVVVGAMTKAGEVNVSEEGSDLLGIENIARDSQSSAGFGVRMDYRLGRSRFTIGADLGWMWKLSGDLFTVNTAPESPYFGTSVQHEGLNFLTDLSYHF